MFGESDKTNNCSASIRMTITAASARSSASAASVVPVAAMIRSVVATGIAIQPNPKGPENELKQ